jgi:cytochrome c-type biogenesis protein CcmE
VPGSIVRQQDGSLTFDVADGRTSVRVRTRAVPPQMFREGIGVVVEGTLNRDGLFEGARLLVSHSNEYRAPHDGETADVRQLIRSTEGLDALKAEPRR